VSTWTTADDPPRELRTRAYQRRRPGVMNVVTSTWKALLAGASALLGIWVYNEIFSTFQLAGLVLVVGGMAIRRLA
jgi:drug/metabolite transporter (DMT)-like permease